MPTVKQTIKEITNPHRRNDLEARRRKLGLSRVALGRILGVDPATVFRRERGSLVALWDYAMRGIEAEARKAKPTLRSHKRGLDLENFIPDQLAAQGSAFTSEKMNQARRQHAHSTRVKRWLASGSPKDRRSAVSLASLDLRASLRQPSGRPTNTSLTPTARNEHERFTSRRPLSGPFGRIRGLR